MWSTPRLPDGFSPGCAIRDTHHAHAEQPWSWACTACAAERVTIPRVSACIVGNARTFGDPRVHESIRHNLLGAMGADFTVFAYLKLTDDIAPGVPLKTPNRHGESLTTNITMVQEALDTLGNTFRVVVKLETARVPPTPNERCKWLRQDISTWPVHRERYIGQLESNQQCLDMVRSHEKRHGMSFTHVLKTRPDAAWPQSAPPWCTLLPHAIYVAHPMPHDWFMLMPRKAADAMLGLHSEYQACKGDTLDRKPLACCGGGVTSLMMRAARDSGLPTMGPPPYPGFAPGSTATPFLFAPLVFRAAYSPDELWCSGVAYKHESRLPDPAVCKSVLMPWASSMG